MVPPKIIIFPTNKVVEICFKSGPVVDGHSGFRADLTEKPETDWVASPNYPEDLGDANYLDPPKHGYDANISQCWVRSPSEGNYLELEFFQFDVSF